MNINPKNENKEKKKKETMSRSLTSNSSFLSSSAPQVSYVQMSKPKLVLKEEKEKEKETDKDKDTHKDLSSVGSPTVFSMLRSDSDVRRKSLTSSLPVLPQEPKTEEREDEDEEEPARLDDKRDVQFPFDPSEVLDDDGPPVVHNRSEASGSGSGEKDSFSSFFN